MLAADEVAEIHALLGAAGAEFVAHARVRLLYAHVQNDVARFTARVERLDEAIMQAEAAGLDITRAAAEADQARASLEAAASVLAGADPDDTGEGALTQLRLAHRAAHAAQSHLRAGFRSLAGQFI